MARYKYTACLDTACMVSGCSPRGYCPKYAHRWRDGAADVCDGSGVGVVYSLGPVAFSRSPAYQRPVNHVASSNSSQKHTRFVIRTRCASPTRWLPRSSSIPLADDPVRRVARPAARSLPEL